MNDDGTVIVTLPSDAREIAVKATYDLSIETYINCDVAKETDKERDIWYPISQILQSGLVAPNECSQTHYTAKPGEFVFFVRKRYLARAAELAFTPFVPQPHRSLR